MFEGIRKKLPTSKVIVIDPHTYPDKWHGCVVVGTGRNYAEVDRALQALVRLMTKRYDEIGKGIVVEQGHTRITILIDEWRAIVYNVKQAGEAIKALLTESRKAAFSVFVATHSDRAKPLGLEGEYDDTPEGRLQKHIRATVAEYEREKIRERMVRGRNLKVKSGQVLTGANNIPSFTGPVTIYDHNLGGAGRFSPAHSRVDFLGVKTPPFFIHRGPGCAYTQYRYLPEFFMVLLLTQVATYTDHVILSEARAKNLRIDWPILADSLEILRRRAPQNDMVTSG
jgi:hypothetical protein